MRRRETERGRGEGSKVDEPIRTQIYLFKLLLVSAHLIKKLYSQRSSLLDLKTRIRIWTYSRSDALTCMLSSQGRR